MLVNQSGMSPVPADCIGLELLQPIRTATTKTENNDTAQRIVLPPDFLVIILSKGTIDYICNGAIPGCMHAEIYSPQGEVSSLPQKSVLKRTPV